MAKNDVLLIDGIIDERVEKKLPSQRRDEVFEYLAFEQILKDFDLSREEIESGSVDGRNDGGIDGFFIFVNGHLLTDPQSFTWPKSGAQLDVWIITCKLHDTFKQAPLDNLFASVSELLDLGIPKEELKGDYSETILTCRENLKLAYRKLSAKMREFSLNYSYSSRGNSADVGESIVARSEQIKAASYDCFGNVNVDFQFHGSSEIVALHRKVPNFSLELPYSEVLSRGERYVLLANLKDYYGFVTEDNKLRRYLFDSNVRDFMGINRVNEDIKDTLENEDAPDFWWLNNGVTILATSASLVGGSIQLQDIQIVNGLQTTESIFNHFSEGKSDANNRSLLIKVIVSQDENIRDSIIRATNNQTSVELSSLHATDKIQRDIEDILERNGYFYERRKNFYLNLGHSPSEIITPLSLAAGFVNLILKSPQKATILKSRFMRSDESYEMVFSEKTLLSVWPRIAFIIKHTDEILEEIRPIGRNVTERFLKRWRQITSLISIARIFNTFNFSEKDLSQLDTDKYTKEIIVSTWNFFIEFKPDSISGSGWRKNSLYIELCQEAASKFNISGIERIQKNNKFQENGPSKLDAKAKEEIKVTMDFALKVHELLPPQPWKPGGHIAVIKELKCTPKDYSQAVSLLVEEGLRNHQKDGVFYDQEGNVLCFDPERVDPETMELIYA
ncbi:Abortive phage infection protein [Shewanella baltica BA175]|uniref:AIPR family protein n=1 Tax=Shewanella baltica TaxID=62322 RepID=UPI0001E4AEE7|nr:AIPR family protein [Shewanella baltica]AEG11077.1 Abortive phage infection protein [Shewanella baltica BA175]